jgi:zinc finger protein ubi-d4
MPGHSNGQLYSYPARRWKKKRRQYLLNDNYLTKRIRESEINGEEVVTNTVENNNRMDVTENFEKFIEESKESWLRDFDDGSDLPDAGELDDPESDYDDYEEYSTRKKKKKKDAPKRKRVEYSDAEKPYSCDLCGARYKTRPGLSYHYSHSHQNDGSNGSNSNSMSGPNSSGIAREDEDMPYTPPRQLHHQSHVSHPTQSTPVPHPPPNMPSAQQHPNQHPMPPMMPQMMASQQHSSPMPPNPGPKPPNPEEEGKPSTQIS